MTKIQELIKQIFTDYEYDDEHFITTPHILELEKILLEKVSQIESPVMQKIAGIKIEDYDKLGDTFIDYKNDAPLTQWRIIAGMLSAEGLIVVKKQ